MVRAWWHVKLIGLGLMVVFVAWMRLHRSLDLPHESDFDALHPARERVYILEEPSSDIFRKEFSRKAFKYLDVLKNSVQIVELPKDLSKVITFSCTKIESKPPLVTSQHSLEVRFPRLLKSMSRVKGDQRLHLLLSNRTGEATNQHRPLFYYIESYAYHAIYCTNKKNGKEDWSRRDPYWKKVGEYLMDLPEWRANVGIDFLAPASHPASGPSRHHPLSLSYLSRVTFLRTDFDVAGSSPKDIIVPYFADPHQFPSNATSKPDVQAPLERKMGTPAVKLNGDDGGDEPELERRQRIVNGGKRWLLFFIGGDNPKNGYRQLLGANMQQHVRNTNSSDVFFSLKPVEMRYMAAMADAKFCLVVRGDTTSSRRLFSAIRAGCVPVIISDWIQLPFESLVDYSLFTLTFPESVVHRVGDFVSALRAVSAAQYEGMCNALLTAQKMLLFESEADEVDEEEQQQQHKQQQQTPSGLRSGTDVDGPGVSTDTKVATSSISVFNPVTLALIEAVRRREGLCSRWHRPQGAAGADADVDADDDLAGGGRKSKSKSRGRGRGRSWSKSGVEIGAATRSGLRGDGSPDASASTSFSDLCVRLETRLRLVGLVLASSH